ncbi:hypothetical protein JCM16106_20070 [Hydrogenophilus islandicus]
MQEPQPAPLRYPPQRWWWGIALACAALAAASVALTHLLRLAPCHLCIFQRFLFMVLALTASGAALTMRRAVLEFSLERDSFGATMSYSAFAAATFLLALGGMGVAGYQTLLQWQPEKFACGGAQLNPIEQFVEWLATLSETLFLPTGFCSDPGLVIVGLTLANWAFLIFGAVAATALWTFFRFQPPLAR